MIGISTLIFVFLLTTIHLSEKKLGFTQPLKYWPFEPQTNPLIKNRCLSIRRLVLKLLQNVQVLKYLRVFNEIKDLNYATLVEKFHLASKFSTHTCLLISFNIVIWRQVVIGYSFVPLNEKKIVLKMLVSKFTLSDVISLVKNENIGVHFLLCKV
jgi:hypothetical protein